MVGSVADILDMGAQRLEGPLVAAFAQVVQVGQKPFRMPIEKIRAIGLVAIEGLIGLACPLTVLEDWLRSSTGHDAGFVQRWLQELLYWDFPGWVFALAYLLFAILVALTYVAFPPVRRYGARRPYIGGSGV
jgi:hypothetical protein